MVSLRRDPTGRPSSRRMSLVGIAAVASLLTLTLGVAPAGAQTPSPSPASPTTPSPAPPSTPSPAPTTTPAPAPPSNAVDAAKQLEQVQHDAEALTEEWHAAQDAVAARQHDLDALRGAVVPAKAAADAARAEEASYREQVDAVAMSTFQSGRLDQFNALLASGSPQDFLDQMSAIETLSADYKDSLTDLSAVIDRTTGAQSEADDATSRAQAAADEAAAAEQDVLARKHDADARIDDAEKLLDRLTPDQRRSRSGPTVTAPDVPVTGTGAGVKALRAAQIQLGKPYEWGAEGPGSFDCSGLTSWAFKQAGVTLPRSSSQQARVGRAVSWDAMQPGDLVFYYSPVSHVGIYAGNGTMVDAPQTGDVVKFQKVSSTAFSGARRV